MSLPSANPDFMMIFWQTSPDQPNPFVIAFGVLSLSIVVWIICIPRGIKAAKEAGKSPHWMWFGVHPIGALIAYFILRHLANRVANIKLEAETAILQAAAIEGGTLTLARAMLYAGLPAEQAQIVLDKFVQLKELIEGAGAEVKFLPACSPDLSPIEECWSKVKTILRSKAARTREALEEGNQRSDNCGEQR